MKKILLVAAAAAIATPAFAAPGDTATTQGSATATIVAPITLTHNSAALAFGTLTSGTGGGTVTVSSGGTVSGTTGDVTVLSGSLDSATRSPSAAAPTAPSPFRPPAVRWRLVPTR